MPRLAPFVTLCALVLGTAAVLFRGDDSFALGSPTDAHITRTTTPSVTEPTLLSPRAETPRESREIERGTGRAILLASVHFESGAAVPDVPVQVIGATWSSARTDRDGVARFELAAGEAEVLVPTRDGCDFVPRYAPEGLSNAALDLRAGEEREVQLLVYRGSGLEVDLRDTAGTPLGGRRVHLHRRESAGWSESEPYTTDERGRVDVLGLPAGSYLVEQGRAGALWFPPRRLDIVSGERRRVALVAEPRREISFGVRALRAGTGEVLPLHFEARLFPRARADEPVPPDHDLRRRGWPQPDGRVTAALHARRYEAELRPRGNVGNRTQLVDPTVSRATIDVQPDGVVDPAEIEVVVADLGPLAVVHGRLETDLEEGEFDVWAAVTRQNGGAEPLWLFPTGAELGFVLVVDLDLLLVRRVEFFDQSGAGAVALGGLDLVRGTQAITLALPRDR